MLPKKFNIFVLSPQEDDAATINSTLRNNGVTVSALWSSDKNDCIKSLEQNNLHLIYFRTNNFSAQDEQLIEQFRNIESTIPIIIIDDELSANSLAASLHMNANDLVTLQISDRLLMVTMRELSIFLKNQELVKLRNEIKNYKQQLEQIQTNSALACVVIQDGIIVENNPAACNLLSNHTLKSLETHFILDFIPPSDQLMLKGALKTVQKNLRNDQISLHICPLDSDKKIKVRCEILQHSFEDEPALKLELHEENQIVNVTKEATEHKLSIDPLTGIYHHAYFITACEEKLTQNLESGIITMLYIKVDHVKQLQTRLDLFNLEKVFSHIGKALIETCNSDDVFGRFGGNSFTVLSYKGSLADVESWAQHFQNYLKEHPLVIDSSEIILHTSIGIAEMLSEKDSLLDLTIRAKDANFEARKSGIGAIHIDQTISESTQTVQFDQQWLPRIKSALMQNRFQLYQFPISSLRADSHNMLDVFLRMKDEVGDLVMPSIFLPVAERNNLIKSLDRWVLGAAIRYIEKNKNTRMFVRLSKASILDNNLLDWCNKILTDYKVPSSNLVIQLTEAHVFDIGPQRLLQSLTNYHSLGYGIAIEHFGRNPLYEQLISTLPIGFIKIDSTLIQGLTESTERQKQVKALCTLARENNILTVAEHVETANSMAILYQLGADYMQGTFTLEPEVIIEAE